MDNETYTHPHRIEDVEIQEWLESLDSVLDSSGPEVAAEILERLRAHATVAGIDLPFSANTPYANTIPARLEPLFPGDQELERPGHGGAGEPRRAQHWRAHFHVRFGSHSIRGGFQPFLSSTFGGVRGRH